MSVLIDDEIAKMGIYVIATTCQGLHADEDRPDVKADLRKVSREITERYDISSLKGHPVVSAYRKFMWKVGIDPTKVRPSGEALVRRTLRKGMLPQINSVVDACNMASSLTLVPISVFDLDRITQPIYLRRALPGELFIDFGGRRKTLTGKEVVVTDGHNRILHLFLYRDSNVAPVTNETRNVLIIGYGVPGVPRHTVRSAVELMVKQLRSYYPQVECGDVVSYP